MFNAIKKVLAAVETLVNFVESLFEFVGMLIESTLNAVALLTESIPFMTTVAGYMPMFLATSFTLLLSIFVVKFLVGR